MTLGIDICSLDRVQALLDHDHFLTHFLTQAEQADWARRGRKLESLAGRFAGKEAISKLLGQGFQGLSFLDLEIFHKPSGQPWVKLSPKAEALLLGQGFQSIALSISHEEDYAVAVASQGGVPFGTYARLCKDQELNQSLLKRAGDGYKFQYGQLGIMGGSRGMAGSVCMGAQAALRTGAGLVHAIVPSSIGLIAQIKLTEAIVDVVDDGGEGHFSQASLDPVLDLLPKFDALAIGPGLGRAKDLAPWMSGVLKAATCPLIIDADGLNVLAQNRDLLDQIQGDFVVTPHAMEMARLTGLSPAEVEQDREGVALDFSKETGAIVVLKGKNTVIADWPDSYVNKSGNPGMATAGSGDVLTGMVGAFLAYGYKMVTGVRLAVYIHGLAGDFARQDLGEEGIIARDLIQAIPKVIQTLQIMNGNF